MGSVPVKIVRVLTMVPAGVASMVPAKGVIWVRQGHPLSVRMLAHELCHILQAERTQNWALAYVAQWLQSGMDYDRMPYEIEARKAEKEPFFRAWAQDLIAEQARR